MFQEIQPLRLPQRPVDGFTVQAASYGGGYILQLSIDGRVETAVFADANALTAYIQFMLSGKALALAEPQPKTEQPKSAATGAGLATSVVSAPKRKGGRPKGAKNKPKLASSLNGAAQKEPDAAPAEARETVEA